MDLRPRKLSLEACKALIEEGITDVVNVEGGTRAWRATGLPIVSDTPLGARRFIARLSSTLSRRRHRRGVTS